MTEGNGDGNKSIKKIFEVNKLNRMNLYLENHSAFLPPIDM